jgi:1-acyl-sn-glycerol-3-phosphate acyltransferase
MLFCMGYFWVEVSGEAIREVHEGKRVVVVSGPHCNFVDGLVIICAGVAVSPVAMAWVSRVPLLGSIFTLCQGIKVVRGGGVTALIQQRLSPGSADANFFPPLVFPEGTTGNGRCLIKFKTGAFVAGAPVQPLVLQYPCCNYSPTWSTASLLTLLARTVCQVYNRASVQVLPVVVPTELELEEPKFYAHNVMEEMAAASGLPLVPVSHTLCPEYLVRNGHKSPVFKCMPGPSAGKGIQSVRPSR